MPMPRWASKVLGSFPAHAKVYCSACAPSSVLCIIAIHTFILEVGSQIDHLCTSQISLVSVDLPVRAATFVAAQQAVQQAVLQQPCHVFICGLS